jgi:hypothetical protein
MSVRWRRTDQKKSWKQFLLNKKTRINGAVSKAFKVVTREYEGHARRLATQQAQRRTDVAQHYEQKAHQ